ncbi:MAG: sodium:solute symporter family protein [Bacillota bacterium]|nr:sodium:solute symporter family protein [Bacillota bacterium]
MSASTIYIALFLYFIIGSLLARRAGKGMSRGVGEFFLAGRSLGGIIAALTYSATTYSAFMLVGLAGFTYIGGVGALGFELIYLSGLILVAFFGPRFWLVGNKYNYLTPTEMLGDRYGSKAVSAVSAVAAVIFLIPYSAVQLIGIGALLEGISGGTIPYLAGVAIAAFIAVYWTWSGGLKAVAWTDSLQAAVMITVAVLSVIFIAYRGFGGFGGMFTQLEAEYPAWLTVPGPGFFNINAFVGLTLPWFFFSLSNPQVSQRLFVPRSLSQMRIMVMGFLVFGFIYTLVSILWGFSARLLLPDLPLADSATPALLGLSIVPAFVALLVMLGISAAAISTVNSIILTLSSMVCRDVFKMARADADESRELLIGKIFVPLFTLVIVAFATMRLDLIAALSVASSAGLLVMVPALVGAFFWKRGTAAAVLTSVVAGGLIATFLQYSGLRPLGQWPGVWSGLVATVLFIGVSLITKPPYKKADEFIGYLQEQLNGKQII